MAREIVMPQMGLSMDSGQIVRWLKNTGDRVHPGELLLEVESDKSIVEVEAIEEGVLHILLGPEEGQIPVGSVIAYMLAEGERAPTTRMSAGERPEPVMEVSAAAEATPAVHPADEVKRLPGRRAPSSPAARRLARELGVDWSMAAPSGLRGQIKQRDIQMLKHSIEQATASIPPPTIDAKVIQITPVARRLAEATGVDLDGLASRHPGKRLERSDIEQELKQAVQRAVGPGGGKDAGTETIPGSRTAMGTPPPGAPPYHRQPAGSLRLLVAERMAGSAQDTAAVTLTTKVDATELVTIRTSLKADAPTEVIPSYNVLIAALTARALVEHPALNATLDGKDILYWEAVNIGIAVDTPRGLVVPVLRDAQAKPVRTLSKEADDLLKRAAEGKAVPDELTGSTFTITNLGIYDIDSFTPIINPPECAVLGIGRLVKENVVVDDQPAIRSMITLSLTFDHRLVDGAPAARFLQRVKQYIEQPYLWLV